jgi:hypothetical protein
MFFTSDRPSPKTGGKGRFHPFDPFHNEAPTVGEQPLTAEEHTAPEMQEMAFAPF